MSRPTSLRLQAARSRVAHLLISLRLGGPGTVGSRPASLEQGERDIVHGDQLPPATCRSSGDYVRTDRQRCRARDGAVGTNDLRLQRARRSAAVLGQEGADAVHVVRPRKPRVGSRRPRAASPLRRRRPSPLAEHAKKLAPQARRLRAGGHCDARPFQRQLGEPSCCGRRSRPRCSHIPRCCEDRLRRGRTAPTALRPPRESPHPSRRSFRRSRRPPFTARRTVCSASMMAWSRGVSYGGREKTVLAIATNSGSAARRAGENRLDLPQLLTRSLTRRWCAARPAARTGRDNCSIRVRPSISDA